MLVHTRKAVLVFSILYFVPGIKHLLQFLSKMLLILGRARTREVYWWCIQCSSSLFITAALSRQAETIPKGTQKDVSASKGSPSNVFLPPCLLPSSRPLVYRCIEIFCRRKYYESCEIFMLALILLLFVDVVVFPSARPSVCLFFVTI